MPIMAKMEQLVDGIPMVLVGPDDEISGDLVLWMSHLVVRPSRRCRCSSASPPPGTQPPALTRSATADVARATRGRLPLRCWRRFGGGCGPILGQTTLDAMRALTWAQEQTGRPGAALAGGVSMGGDVAVALAGIDDRVRRVAAVGSTPNWSRPDMRELRDPSVVIAQGDADAYSQWFADHLDPSRHLERYRRGTAITFELGEADHHIPCENASVRQRA